MTFKLAGSDSYGEIHTLAQTEKCHYLLCCNLVAWHFIKPYLTYISYPFAMSKHFSLSLILLLHIFHVHKMAWFLKPEETSEEKTSTDLIVLSEKTDAILWIMHILSKITMT